jgi:hypothetical protein
MKGIKLDQSNSVSLLAMIYYIFVSVNALTYYAMTTLQTFFAVVKRLSSVFEMEEYESKREEILDKSKV